VRALYKFLIVVLILVLLLYFLQWVILAVNVYKQLLDAFITQNYIMHMTDSFVTTVVDAATAAVVIITLYTFWPHKELFITSFYSS
jgi:hypothetical protein